MLVIRFTDGWLITKALVIRPFGLDEFYQHWIDEKIVQSHISNGKNLCIVSPDLHKRNFINEWEEYKKILFSSNQSDQLMICTDYPEKAEKFFELN